MKKVRKLDKNTLVQLGMKQALVDKLGDKVIQNLLAIYMDNHKKPELLHTLIKLASMELNNKQGASILAVLGIATTEQMKELKAEQIKQVVEDYQYHEDEKICIKMVKEMLIANQQEKMFLKSDGLKGELYVDPAYKEDEERA